MYKAKLVVVPCIYNNLRIIITYKMQHYISRLVWRESSSMETSNDIVSACMGYLSYSVAIGLRG
jgi:hypothetical protein